MRISTNIRQSFSNYSWGKYVLHPRYANNKALLAWIEQVQFKNFETENHQIKKHSRQRNALYSFYLEAVQKEVVLKVSDNTQYRKWYRKLNQKLTTPFKNYSLNAFYGGIGFEENNLNSVKTIAYWTCKANHRTAKSYLLYEKVISPMSAHELYQQIIAQHSNANEIVDALATNLATTVKKIHACNMRHGDPHAGNFLLLDSVPNIAMLTADTTLQLKFTLIDLDKTTFTRNTVSMLKKIYDLRCLRRFRLGNIEGINSLQYYLGRTPSSSEKFTLLFWMRGGFNIYKWFKKSEKRI